MRTAVTHAGAAHADEFIALAILIAKQGLASIERRNPTPEELADPEVWVLDVGGQHEPDLKNFDHHGVEGTEGRCAFDLLLDYFGMSEAASASPWLKFKSSLDCAGPYATAKEFSMPADSLFATISPIESQALQAFSKAKSVVPGDFLYQLMELVGQGLCEYWAEYSRQLAAADTAAVIEVKGETFCDYRACGDKLMPAVMFRHMTKVKAAGSVTLDDRDPGCEDRVVLYRHADNPRVDFRRLDASKMHFVHHGGFLAKTATGDKSLEKVTELLTLAVE